MCWWRRRRPLTLGISLQDITPSLIITTCETRDRCCCIILPPPPFFVCVCGAACRVLYFLFNLLVSVDHPENTPLCVFCSNFKIFRGLRNRLFFSPSFFYFDWRVVNCVVFIYLEGRLHLQLSLALSFLFLFILILFCLA